MRIEARIFILPFIWMHPYIVVKLSFSPRLLKHYEFEIKLGNTSFKSILKPLKSKSFNIGTAHHLENVKAGANFEGV
ncbi:MAG: hypothetical protein QXR89_07620 [Candidatus Bathyarchaeia archaeon]